MNCKKTVQRDIWSVLKFYACCYKFTKKEFIFTESFEGILSNSETLKNSRLYIHFFDK